MQIKKVSEILGRTYKLSPKKEKIYKNLKLADDTDENNLEERILNIFRENLSYRENELLKFTPLQNFSLFDSMSFVKLERSTSPSAFGDFKNKNKNIFSNFLYSLSLKRRKIFDRRSQKIKTSLHKRYRL